MTQPWTLLTGSARLGVAVGRQAARPVVGVVAVGQRAGARLALDALDALLASTVAEVAADRVLASPWTERTVTKALGGPLVDVAAREIAQGAVLERVLDEVLATEVLDHIVDRAEQAGRRAPARRARARRRHRRARRRAVPRRSRVRAARGAHGRQPGVERAVASVFESRLLDQVVARLLARPGAVAASSTRSPAARR